jgi:hypothetical protein
MPPAHNHTQYVMMQEFEQAFDTCSAMPFFGFYNTLQCLPAHNRSQYVMMQEFERGFENLLGHALLWLSKYTTMPPAHNHSQYVMMQEFERAFEICKAILFSTRHSTDWAPLFEPLAFFEVPKAFYVLVRVPHIGEPCRVCVNACAHCDLCGVDVFQKPPFMIPSPSLKCQRPSTSWCVCPVMENPAECV